ncbi:hypothetical protein VULLAG_LOCUS17963 [Vulpes lagopus]
MQTGEHNREQNRPGTAPLRGLLGGTRGSAFLSWGNHADVRSLLNCMCLRHLPRSPFYFTPERNQRLPSCNKEARGRRGWNPGSLGTGRRRKSRGCRVSRSCQGIPAAVGSGPSRASMTSSTRPEARWGQADGAQGFYRIQRDGLGGCRTEGRPHPCSSVPGPPDAPLSSAAQRQRSVRCSPQVVMLPPLIQRWGGQKAAGRILGPGGFP